MVAISTKVLGESIYNGSVERVDLIEPCVCVCVCR